MQFLFPQLTWGFLLIGVPILIHLINMLRQRRRQWAAMDFLLASYKKNRRWVMLRQWLLLAARILAMVLLVLMMAKWVSNTQWLQALGGQTTHHYVLLDDSYSMSEETDGESAYQRALSALGGLVRNISSQGGTHQITLLRYSRGWLAANSVTTDSTSGVGLDAAAELSGVSVTGDPDRLLDRISASSPSSLSIGPDAPMQVVAPMLAESSDEIARVYLLTDLRRSDFSQPAQLQQQLEGVSDQLAELTVVDCSAGESQNLTLVSVEPENDIWSAGVPVVVKFGVRNASASVLQNVVCKLRSVDYSAATAESSQDLSGVATNLPSILIDRIEPGQTVTRQFEVLFSGPGSHVVEVALPDDALATDNRRWSVINIGAAQRVLLVDGDVEQRNAFYVSSAAGPDSRVQTGIRIDTTDAAQLRDMASAVLEQYDVVCLLDVPRLDPEAIENIESFVRAGGGLLHVVGPLYNMKNINESMYRDGDGFFPGEVQGVEVFARGGVASEGDRAVKLTEHPVMQPLTQLEQSPMGGLEIRTLLRLAEAPRRSRGIETVVEGPAGLPLMLDMPFGDGRVLTLLSGFDQEWSNWPQDPTFVVLVLRSLGYLSGVGRDATSYVVGSPLEFASVSERLLPDAEILLPSQTAGARLRVASPVKEVELDEGRTLAEISLPIELGQTDRDVIDSLLRAGVYEAWLRDSSGEALVVNRAHNVSVGEGDLSRVSRSELERNLPGVPLRIRTAAEVEGQGLAAADASQSTLIMVLLAGLLVIEQFLGYLASYHAPSTSSEGV